MRVHSELINRCEEIFNQKIRSRRIAIRDLQIVEFYYGFYDAKCPTYDETLNRLKIDGITTRERIRQIISEFREKGNLDKLPELSLCAEILNSSDAISSIEYLSKLAENKLIEEDASVSGLIRYMHDFGLCMDYDCYSPYLEKTNGNDEAKFNQLFIFKKEIAKDFYTIFKKVKNLPGNTGIASFDRIRELFPLIKDKDEYLIKEVIRSQNAWVTEIQGQFWFTYESREKNVFNTYSKKLFNIIDWCDSRTLSKVYLNALGRRGKKCFPPEEIIQLYLETSRNFNIFDGKLFYLGSTSPLEKIEVEIINYLKKEGFTPYNKFKEYLGKKGFPESYIEKSLLYSPLVWVDKTKGRKHFIFSLVSGSVNEEKFANLRYQEFRNLLNRFYLLGTDSTIRANRRNEQEILRNWLFQDKEFEKCAICGGYFNTSALVAAHKKPRNKCSEIERTDPNIVMPVCVFGCDYLYEKRIISIDEKGKININRSKIKSAQTVEYLKAKQLEGRFIPEIWLKGTQTYFL